jgi:hypothetical protein
LILEFWRLRNLTETSSLLLPSCHTDSTDISKMNSAKSKYNPAVAGSSPVPCASAVTIEFRPDKGIDVAALNEENVGNPREIERNNGGSSGSEGEQGKDFALFK